MLGIELVDFRPGAGGGAPQGDVLLLVGFEYGIEQPLQEYMGGFKTVVAISSRKTAITDAAKVTLPGLTFAEKEGLIVNFEGHIQQVSPAFTNLWDRTPPWAIVARLTTVLTGESSFDNIAALRSAIASEEASFSGIDLNAGGDTGVRAEGQAV